MHFNRFTRRHFLRGLGGMTLTLPLLPSMMPRAYGAVTNPNKRAFFFWNDNHVVFPKWYPNPALSDAGGGVKFASLSAMSSISPILNNATWGELRKKMVLPRGLMLAIDSQVGHVTSAPLCLGIDGVADTYDRKLLIPSLDQVLAYSNSVYPSGAVQRALNFSPDAINSISYRLVNGERQQVKPYTSPRAIFDLLFSGALPSATPTPAPTATPRPTATPMPTATPRPGATPAPTPRPTATPVPTPVALDRNQKRMKVVDAVLPELKSLMSNRRLSAEEKHALDADVTAINELANRFRSPTSMSMYADAAATAAPVCSKPGIPMGPSSDPTKRDQLYKDFVDVMAAAVRCGFTNVGSLMMSGLVDDFDYRHCVSSLTDVGFHKQSHMDNDQAAIDHMSAIQAYFGSIVARFCKAIDVVENPTTGMTYLDNSLVMWHMEHGGTNGGSSHHYVDLAVALIGSAGGNFKTDLFIDYRGVMKDQWKNQGVPYNWLMNSIADAMNISPADYETQGRAGYGLWAGTPEQGTGHSPHFPDLTMIQMRSLLPYLKK